MSQAAEPVPSRRRPPGWGRLLEAASMLRSRWGSQAMLLVLPALVVGAGAGLAAVGFRWLITGATWVFSGHADYSAVTGHPANPWVPWLGPAFVVVAPAVGGLIYGPLVQRFAREARGHGVPEVMYAVTRRGGRIKGSVAVVKALASAITIGSGGSVGREGPIVQIGSALGSTLGRVLRMPESRLRTLVACGAAGGIAATFNAPIAGVFFALELLLRDFAAASFGAVVVSSVTASIVGRSLLGDTPFLALPSFHVENGIEYLLFAALGLVAGLVGVLFTKTLYAVEDLSDRLWRGPEWLRPGVGGLLLGALLLLLPQLYGVGYPVLERGVRGDYAIGFLLVLLVGKIVATSLTIGIGGSGGVFAPSLFLGAMTGAAAGEALGAVDPALAGQTGAFALVGMAAAFAGSARAPITATIILFELTGEYSIILPLLLAVVVATAVSTLVSRDTVYTAKLRRRGVDLEQASPGDRRLAGTTVGQAMTPPPPALPAGMPLSEVARALLASGRRALPVERDGVYTGLADDRSVSEALAGDETHALTAGDVADERASLVASASLSDALDVLLASGSGGLPVVDDDGRPIGWLAQDSVLRVLSTTRT